MTAAQTTHVKKPDRPANLPPLQNGDRMTRAEFERRWEQMPGLKRAELINGMVLVAAATRHDQHGEPHATLLGVLAYYYARTPGVRIGDASSLRLDEDNEPQPDGLLFVPREAGGQAAIDAEGYVVGGPEFVAEVSASSVSIDLHDKLDTYRRHGVREYLVWRVLDAELDWFELREGRFDRVTPVKSKAGRRVYESKVFPGLWIDIKALLKKDLAKAFMAIDEGTAEPAHGDFVQRLKQA